MHVEEVQAEDINLKSPVYHIKSTRNDRNDQEQEQNRLYSLRFRRWGKAAKGPEKKNQGSGRRTRECDHLQTKQQCSQEDRMCEVPLLSYKVKLGTRYGLVQVGLLMVGGGVGVGLTLFLRHLCSLCAEHPGEDEAASGRVRLCSGVCRVGLGSCCVHQDGWERPLWIFSPASQPLPPPITLKGLPFQSSVETGSFDMMLFMSGPHRFSGSFCLKSWSIMY